MHALTAKLAKSMQLHLPHWNMYEYNVVICCYWSKKPLGGISTGWIYYSFLSCQERPGRNIIFDDQLIIKEAIDLIPYKIMDNQCTHLDERFNVCACEGAIYFGRTKISFKWPKDDPQQVPFRAGQSQSTAGSALWGEKSNVENKFHLLRRFVWL